MTGSRRESADERKSRTLGSSVALTSEMPLKRLRLKKRPASTNMMTEADTMLASLLFSVYDDVRFLTYLSMDGGQKFIVWLLMASIAPSLLVMVGSSQKLGFSGNLSCSTTTKLACSVGRCRAEVAYIGGLQLQLHILTREGNSKVSVVVRQSSLAMSHIFSFRVDNNMQGAGVHHAPPCRAAGKTHLRWHVELLPRRR